MLSKRISRFIEEQGLLHKDARHLIAFSGGADSVAMLTVLHELGYNIEAAHCNFHLRGTESERDEKFCQSMCNKMGIPLHIAHYDTRTYAKVHKISIEMAARELRYRYFQQLRKDLCLEEICVAHHRDDSVETVLMNLIRGTGIHGLTGILPRNGHVVRPLLCVSRDEIEEFLHQRNLEFVIDSTNLVDNVVRNKIRLNILPLMKEINSAASENIAKTSLRLVEVEKILNNTLQSFLFRVETDGFILRKELLESASPEYLLFQLLTPKDFSPSQIEQIAANIAAPSGRMWSSKTHDLLFDRECILIEKHDETIKKCSIIPETGTYVFDDRIRIGLSLKKVDKNFSISRKKNVICLDAKAIKFPLKFRLTSNGDRFVPFGMNGTKLVSDYLTDHKKTIFEKRKQRVLVNSNGDILWLVGERLDNRYRIEKNSELALIVSVEYL
ncbi:MAG: tRNA lysidine(34) synthetase TilS [Prevotella sp.]|nr:tRNA lysidine(34) synthetase TilS [Prevotella sp.]